MTDVIQRNITKATTTRIQQRLPAGTRVTADIVLGSLHTVSGMTVEITGGKGAANDIDIIDLFDAMLLTRGMSGCKKLHVKLPTMKYVDPNDIAVYERDMLPCITNIFARGLQDFSIECANSTVSDASNSLALVLNCLIVGKLTLARVSISNMKFSPECVDSLLVFVQHNFVLVHLELLECDMSASDMVRLETALSETITAKTYVLSRGQTRKTAQYGKNIDVAISVVIDIGDFAIDSDCEDIFRAFIEHPSELDMRIGCSDIDLALSSWPSVAIRQRLRFDADDNTLTGLFLFKNNYNFVAYLHVAYAMEASAFTFQFMGKHPLFADKWELSDDYTHRIKDIFMTLCTVANIEYKIT